MSVISSLKFSELFIDNMTKCDCCKGISIERTNFHSHLKSYDHFLNEINSKFQNLKSYTQKFYLEASNEEKEKKNRIVGS
jgi:hypothetical protein